MNIAGFIPCPEQSGHAAGLRCLRPVRMPVHTPKYPQPIAFADVVEVDAVRITDFNRLRGGEAAMLLADEFPKFFSQFFG